MMQPDPWRQEQAVMQGYGVPYPAGARGPTPTMFNPYPMGAAMPPAGYPASQADYEEKHYPQPAVSPPPRTEVPTPAAPAAPIQKEAPQKSFTPLYALLCFLLLVTIPILALTSYTVDKLNTKVLPSVSSEAVVAAQAPSASSFGYTNPNKEWTGTCASGKEQSPIDLKTSVDTSANMPQVSIANFQDVGNIVKNKFSDMAKVQNSGHSVQTDSFTSFFNYNGVDYKLVQFHTHTGSEHTIDGKQAAIEVHFVHQSLEGKYLVIGVLGQEGETSPSFLRTIATNTRPEVSVPTIINLDFSTVLKEIGISDSNTPYFAYPGSFTTPPCTEGVQWVVLQKTITVTKEDVEKIHAIEHSNNRPTQALNARTVQKST